MRFSPALILLLLFVCTSYADSDGSTDEVIPPTTIYPRYKILQSGLTEDDVRRNIENFQVSDASDRKRAGSLTPVTPSDIKKIYNITTDPTAGAGKTVAIIGAFGSPTIEDDLNVFSSYFGLPACTTANGCFKKVDETGGQNFAAPSTGWVPEIALDVQTVHSIAPGAKILLILAQSDSTTHFLPALTYAINHADYVSMSWGLSEPTWTATADAQYFSKNAAVSFFAASGDSGAAVDWPAVSPLVIGVGGTSLYLNKDKTLATENGWTGSGGGCSSITTAPTAQATFSGYAQTGCAGKRAVPDVSAVANPQSGVYVYNSYQCNNATKSCFLIVGGTSAAAPLFAARAAISGRVVNSAYVYGNNIVYRDIVTGNNINSQNFGYQCTTGLDLVTGRGSWVDPSLGAAAATSSSTKAATSTATATTAKSSSTASAASPSTSASTPTTTASSNELETSVGHSITVSVLVVIAHIVILFML